jgi:predicted nucleotidyltransferase
MPTQPTRQANRRSPAAKKRTLSNRTLREIVRRVVEVAQPERIILFGSAARGEMGPNSDVDLLVVKANAHRRQLAQQIYRNLIGVGQAVDVVVVTPDDIERYRNTHALIIAPALREGKVVYAA